MLKFKKRIGLRGREYVAPKTESARIVNQGVLCASGGGVTSVGPSNIEDFHPGDII